MGINSGIRFSLTLGISVSIRSALGLGLRLGAWVSEGGSGKAKGSPWNLKIQQKKVVFLVSRGKKQISPL